jgi:hypothetical protein
MVAIGLRLGADRVAGLRTARLRCVGDNFDRVQLVNSVAGSR